MTVIKSTTKKGQELMNRADNNEGIVLSDVYKSVSWEKELAWRECLLKCHEEHGIDFHICSHNSFKFSVAWETEKGIRIETRDNSYLILFPEYC